MPSKPPFDDEDDDEFSPFSKPKTILYKPRADLYNSTSSKDDVHAPSSETGESASSASNSYDLHGSGEEDQYAKHHYPEYARGMYGHDEAAMPDEEYAISHGGQYRPKFGEQYGSFRERDRDGQYSDTLHYQDRDYLRDKERDYDPSVPEGMTPLDVLVQVFGATIPPTELENILAAHGWNFDDAMGYLVERGAGGGPGTPGAAGPMGSHLPSRQASYGPGMDERFERPSTFVGRQGMGPPGSAGRGVFVPSGPGRDPRRMERPGRVCRYFLAGECLRADCRFRSVPLRSLGFGFRLTILFYVYVYV